MPGMLPTLMWWAPSSAAASKQQLADLVGGLAARVAGIEEPVHEELELEVAQPVVVEGLLHLARGSASRARAARSACQIPMPAEPDLAAPRRSGRPSRRGSTRARRAPRPARRPSSRGRPARRPRPSLSATSAGTRRGRPRRTERARRSRGSRSARGARRRASLEPPPSSPQTSVTSVPGSRVLDVDDREREHRALVGAVAGERRHADHLAVLHDPVVRPGRVVGERQVDVLRRGRPCGTSSPSRARRPRRARRASPSAASGSRTSSRAPRGR